MAPRPLKRKRTRDETTWDCDGDQILSTVLRASYDENLGLRMMLRSVGSVVCPELPAWRADRVSGRCFSPAESKREELAGEGRRQQECWLLHGVLAGTGVGAISKPEEWQHLGLPSAC